MSRPGSRCQAGSGIPAGVVLIVAIAGSWALLYGLLMACWGIALLVPHAAHLGELAGYWLRSWTVRERPRTSQAVQPCQQAFRAGQECPVRDRRTGLDSHLLPFPVMGQ